MPFFTRLLLAALFIAIGISSNQTLAAQSSEQAFDGPTDSLYLELEANLDFMFDDVDLPEGALATVDNEYDTEEALDQSESEILDGDVLAMDDFEDLDASLEEFGAYQGDEFEDFDDFSFDADFEEFADFGSFDDFEFDF